MRGTITHCQKVYLPGTVYSLTWAKLAFLRRCVWSHMHTCRSMLLDLAPASEVPLPEENMATVAPILGLAYGE